MYIDVHTHNPNPSTDIHSVVSLYNGFDGVHELRACSVGLHPWYLDDVETRWQQLKQVATLPNVLAIGECGLDKVTETDWQLQLTAFGRQVALAQQLGKPLIIHCVRAWEEVMLLLDEQKVSVPVIFHGFNKNPQLARQLIGHGYWLSFGSALLKPGHAAESLRGMPAPKLFLETDRATQDIRHIYAAAAGILKTSEEDLILQLRKNFKTVFNR